MEKMNFKKWYQSIIEKCFLIPWKWKWEKRKRRKRNCSNLNNSLKKWNNRIKNKVLKRNPKMSTFNKKEKEEWTFRSLLKNWRTIIICFLSMTLIKNSFILNKKKEENCSLRRSKQTILIKLPLIATEWWLLRKEKEQEILSMMSKIRKKLLKKHPSNLSTSRRKIKVNIFLFSLSASD